MSFQAVTWAIGQKAGGPSAKAALCSIANYANEHWCAWPSQRLICEESEQSPDAIQRRLPDLEGRRIIRRIPLRFAGRKTVDFFVLAPSPYFSASLEEIEPLLPRGCSIDPRFVAKQAIENDNDASDSDDCHDADAAAFSGSALPQTLPQIAENAAALERQQEPIIEPIESGDTRARERLAKGLALFEQRWPTAAADDRARTGLAWAELSEEDRENALIGIGPFLETLREHKRSATPAGWKYLEQRRWKVLPPEKICATVGKFQPDLPANVVDVDSDVGRAYEVLHQIALMPAPFHAAGKYILRVPLAPQAMALAAAPRDHSQWVLINAQQERQQAGAWLELLAKFLKGKPRGELVRQHKINRREEPDEQGNPRVVFDTVKGFYAPWPWPPCVDGSLSRGPPLAPGLSEEEAAEFCK